jgi:Sigma-70, region 4
MTAAAQHHADAPGSALVLVQPDISAPRPYGLFRPPRAPDVRAALAQLTPEHRQVITEMYFRGHSVAEISQALGIPAGTVKSRTYYGLRQLRRAVRAMSGDLAAPMDRPGGTSRNYREMAVNTPQ